jgi:hypothetical protein
MSESISGSPTIKMITGSVLSASKNTTHSIANYARKISTQSQYVTKEELHHDGKFHSFTSNVEDIQRSGEYRRNLHRVSVEMNQADVVMGHIIDDVSEAKAFLTQARTPLGRDMFVDTRIRDHLSTLVSHLNSRFNDKALFSGFNTDVLPVSADTVDKSNLIYDSKNDEWVATSNYAVGDQSKKIVMVDDNIQVEYGILASDPAFVKIIGAYHQILSDVENEENLKAGYDALDDAFRALTEKRADFGAKMRQVEESMTSWTQIEEDLIVNYQDLYGNNAAVIAELMSLWRELIDTHSQQVSMAAALARHSEQVIDRLSSH